MTSTLANYLYLTASRSGAVYLIGAISSLILGVVLARGLGVAGYGIFGLAMVAASIGANLSSGGLHQLACYEIAANQAMGKHTLIGQYIRWSFRANLFLSLPISMLVGALLFYGYDSSLQVAAAAAATTFLMSVVWLLGSIMRGLGSIAMGQALDVAIRPAIGALLIVALSLSVNRIDPETALSASAIALLITPIMVLPWTKKVWRVWQTALHCAEHPIKSRWRRSAVAMGFSHLIPTLEAAFPILILAAISIPNEAGFYRVASLIMIFGALPVTMVMQLVPAITSRLLHSGDLKGTQQLAAAACAMMICASSFALFLMWMFGDHLIFLAFGEAYSSALQISLVLLASVAVISAGGISTALLHSAGRSREVAKGFGLSVVVTACTTPFLAETWDGVGAASGLLLGTLFRTIYLTHLTFRHMKIDPSIVGSAHLIFSHFIRSR